MCSLDHLEPRGLHHSCTPSSERGRQDLQTELRHILPQYRKMARDYSAVRLTERQPSQFSLTETVPSLQFKDDDVDADLDATNLLKCSSTSEVIGCDLEGKLLERAWRQARSASSTSTHLATV
ncbi:hypothetical protein SCA6_006052 [Theobroma cacao]